jgi:hypothetical protein
MNQHITTTTYMRSLIYGHHQMIITAYISKWKVGSNKRKNGFSLAKSSMPAARGRHLLLQMSSGPLAELTAR